MKVNNYVSGQDFSTLIVEEMSKQLGQPYGSTKATKLASLVEKIAACAEFLEDLGHPLAKEADSILFFVAQKRG